MSSSTKLRTSPPETGKFKHKCLIGLRFVDIDAVGHVNNAHYLTYAEQARVFYFDAAIPGGINWKSEGLILANATIDYLRPILLEDTIYAYSRCKSFGTKSFEMEYLFVAENKDTEPRLMARLSSILVAFNYETGRSIEIPVLWRKEIAGFEGMGV